MFALGGLAQYLPAKQSFEVLSEALTAARSIENCSARAEALGRLAPHLPTEFLPEALTIVRSIEDPSTRAFALGDLAPQLSGHLLHQGFEELLIVLPRCARDVSLFAVSSFFPFLEELQGLKGLEEVQRMIVDTARWFP